MSSKIRVILVVVIVIAAGIGCWMYYSKNVSASVSDRDLLSVQRVDFPLIISATGTLEASQSVSVGPPQVRRQRQFKLMRMVPEGTVVSEGDFLMEFDTSDINNNLRDETAQFQKVQEQRQQRRSDMDLQLRQQRLNLEQAKSDLEKLEVKINTQADLISGIQVEEARINRDAGRRKVELLEQKLKYVTESGQLAMQINRNDEMYSRSKMDDLLDAIDSYVVRSPAAGIVIYKRDWNNEAKEVGSNVNGMDTVLEIPDLATLRAKIQVDELDSGKVKIGQEASITVDAVQGRSFIGKVIGVGTILKQATFDRPQKVNDIYVEISNPDTSVLRPGMSIKAQIRVGEHPQAVVIPMTSIEERDGRSFVQVYDAKNRKFDWREIQLRMNDGLRAVVESGLEASEKIRSRPKV